AVAKARESDFALILLAVQLPGLSGFETAQRLRAQERSARTPLLFLCAHESADFSPAKAYALGAVDYLLQPLIPEILRAKVSQLVSLRRDTRAQLALPQGDAESRRLLEFHEAVMANMGEGLYAVDMQGLVTYMNPAAESLLGWKSAELLGRKIHDMIHYQHRDGSSFPVEECAAFQVLHEGKVLKDH